MKIKTLISSAVLASAFTLASVFAQGTVVYSGSGTVDLNEAANWETGERPGFTTEGNNITLDDKLTFSADTIDWTIDGTFTTSGFIQLNNADSSRNSHTILRFGEFGKIVTGGEFNFSAGSRVEGSSLQIHATLTGGTGVQTRDLITVTGGQYPSIWSREAILDGDLKSIFVFNEGYKVSETILTAAPDEATMVDGVAYIVIPEVGDKLSVVYKGSAIPEPSTFGLLAGLGALALVVSRRRRSRRN